MALIPGTRLGPYDIIAPIGECGMGQVFRARDTKLDRDVAIKILPEALIMAAPYAVVGDAFRADTRQVWSPTSIQGASTTGTSYDLHPDGMRVATVVAPEQASSVQDHVVFVSNFGDYLRTIAPGT